MSRDQTCGQWWRDAIERLGPELDTIECKRALVSILETALVDAREDLTLAERAIGGAS